MGPDRRSPLRPERTHSRGHRGTVLRLHLRRDARRAHPVDTYRVDLRFACYPHVIFDLYDFMQAMLDYALLGPADMTAAWARTDQRRAESRRRLNRRRNLYRRLSLRAARTEEQWQEHDARRPVPRYRA